MAHILVTNGEAPVRSVLVDDDTVLPLARFLGAQQAPAKSAAQRELREVIRTLLAY
jgi:hypothetical protein